MKITVVGAGKVGSMVAQRVAEKDLADVVLIDISGGLSRGLSLDLAQSAPISGFDVKIAGTDDYGLTAGSDLVVMTAGFARTPGMSRLDLLKRNAGVVRDVMVKVRETSPAALVVVVTNPVDEMTYLSAEVTGFPKNRVIGMAGTLDSARYKHFISEVTGVPHGQISARVLGSHGDCMVPLVSSCTVDGRELSAVLDADKIRELTERTRNGGSEIVAYLESGSAYFAPSAATVEMVEAIVADVDRTLPVSAFVEGQFGLSDIFIGVPARLGRAGVTGIVEIALSESEQEGMRRAGDLIAEKLRDLKSVGLGQT